MKVDCVQKFIKLDVINMKKVFSCLVAIFVCVSAVAGLPQYSAAMIESHGREWSAAMGWDYVSGLVTKTMLMYCKQYPDDELSTRAYGWCKTYTDNAVDSRGNFYNFRKGSLDNIASAKVLLDLYEHESLTDPAEAERYRVAAEYLYRYLRYEYTRITLADGRDGFIHKDSYPYQMWLDGLYMGAAFYAEYVGMFAPDDDEAWSDIALQFKTIHSHTYDTDKQLNYHGWSAKPTDSNSFWANRNEPYKGCSKEFWGRGMGWYAAALVDVLDVMPRDHSDYASLAEIFGQVAEGILRRQDAKSGVWYQLLQYDDTFVSARGRRNYLEASASCMFTYALLKGIRLGLLDADEVGPAAEKAYSGLIDTFITESAAGVDIHNICRSAGLGPFYNPERNGTADYYLDGSDVNIVSNEGKGIGSFIMASLEYERRSTSSVETVKTAPIAPAVYLDLHGRRYSSAPATGLYIEISDGHATKRIAR